MIRKPVKDGLGNSVRSYDVKPKKLKLGSREHKLKFPARYASVYTSSLEQAAFPEPGTAPSEVAAAKKIVNEQYKDPTSISADEIKYLKPKSLEIKKAPTYFPTNERMPETSPPNFEPVDIGLFKGLGSFLVTTRKDYQK